MDILITFLGEVLVFVVGSYLVRLLDHLYKKYFR